MRQPEPRTIGPADRSSSDCQVRLTYHGIVYSFQLLCLSHVRLDRVPCFEHALGKRVSPFEERLAWVRAAMSTAGPRVEVSDIERRLAPAGGGASYTIDLLDALAREHPDHAVRLVVGSDILSSGETQRWRDWPRIEAEYAPIVIPRAGHSPAGEATLPEISSSELRALVPRARGLAGTPPDEAMAARARLETLVPAAVAQLLLAEPGGEVLLVGGGNVARHAAPWLQGRGLRVVELGARSLLAGHDRARVNSTDWRGVWILCTDSALSRVAAALVEALGEQRPPVLHAAGAVPAASALAPLVAAGFAVGTLHPICSLRRERSRSLLAEAGFGIEGDEAARELALAWVGAQPWLDLGGLDARGRRAYHAACSLVANHLAVLWGEGTDILVAQGHPQATAAAVLATLLRSALDNLVELGIPRGVTGPVARGDLDAVAAHLAALDDGPRELYRELSERLRARLGRAP